MFSTANISCNLKGKFLLLIVILLVSKTHQQDEVKYFRVGDDVEFQCFHDDDRPSDSEIEDFKWSRGRVYGINEEDINEYEELKLGMKRADLVMINMTSNPKTVSCQAKIKGQWRNQKRYSVKIGRLPTVKISSGGKYFNNTFESPANEILTFTCEAKNGNPPSKNITFFINDSMIDYLESEESISFERHLTQEDNGNVLECRVVTIFEEVNETLVLNITFPPVILDGKSCDSITDNSCNLTVIYKANPLPTRVVWFMSDNCSDHQNLRNFQNVYKLDIKTLSVATNYESSIVLTDTNTHTSDWCFEVENSEGSSKWLIPKPEALIERATTRAPTEPLSATTENSHGIRIRSSVEGFVVLVFVTLVLVEF